SLTEGPGVRSRRCGADQSQNGELSGRRSDARSARARTACNTNRWRGTRLCGPGKSRNGRTGDTRRGNQKKVAPADIVSVVVVCHSMAPAFRFGNPWSPSTTSGEHNGERLEQTRPDTAGNTVFLPRWVFTPKQEGHANCVLSASLRPRSSGH